MFEVDGLHVSVVGLDRGEQEAIISAHHGRKPLSTIPVRDLALHTPPLP